jgi:hypothetical protein
MAALGMLSLCGCPNGWFPWNIPTNGGDGQPSVQFTISGRVTEVHGAGLSGVIMKGLPGAPVTAANGEYTATVAFGFSGTATPTVAYYGFSPPSRSYRLVTSSRADQNFVGSFEGTGPTYYVAANNPNADNRNPGTEALPWKTLSRGAEMASAGDTVVVKAGTYYESLKPRNSGTAGAFISFRANPGDPVVIDGQYRRDYNVDLRNRSYVRVQGFEIVHSGSHGVYLGWAGQSAVTGVQILGNLIHDNVAANGYEEGGVTIGPSDGTLVRGNQIYNNRENGIRLVSREIHNLSIVDNSISGNGKDGIITGGGSNWLIKGNEFAYHVDPYGLSNHPDSTQFQEGVAGLQIINNVFCDVAAGTHVYITDDLGNGDVWSDVEICGNLMYVENYDRLYVKSIGIGATEGGRVTNITIYGNTIVNTYFGILIDGTGTSLQGAIQVRNNIISGTTVAMSNEYAPTADSDYNLFSGGAISWNAVWYDTLNEFLRANPDQESHSVGANPGFRNAGLFDFSLAPGSPAIDKGGMITGLTVDLLGTTRPQGTAFDIGACEYKP